MRVIFPRVSDLCGAMLSQAEGRTHVTSTLSLAETAEMLRTTAETVSDCIRHRGLPAAKIGRAWVLVDDDVISWLRLQYPCNRDSSHGRNAQDIARTVSTHRYPDALDRALAPRRREPRVPGARR